MNNFENLAAQYIAVWNETDDDKRRRAVEALWSAQGRYIDPLAEAKGIAEIAATIGAVQTQFAGLRFTLAGRSMDTMIKRAFSGASARQAKSRSSSASTSSSAIRRAGSPRCSDFSTRFQRPDHTVVDHGENFALP